MLLSQLVPDLLLDDDLLPDHLIRLLVSPDHLALYTLLLCVSVEEFPAEGVHLEIKAMFNKSKTN
mgnify:FL=1